MVAARQAAVGADFADALIEQLGREAWCDTTVTFDHNAGERAGMRLLARVDRPRHTALSR
ncbi:hypothetical protein AB4305_28610 [Nocardia sp. 2YAB30]|uniref:hypothetical protein n=1 Tax=unclassified Nocardia TaxID=2637762 RepID=UPI003F9B1766